MLTDYVAAGPQEVWNTARLSAYLANVGSPFTSGASICACETLTPAMVGEEDGMYTTPVADPAPWYDPDLPESGDFLGFMPLSVTGLEDSPRSRNVTNAVGGGGVFGPVRDLPRTVTVTGLLIGLSCCGAEYGVHYLTEALAGCTGDTCEGDCLTLYNCCPGAATTKAVFDAAHRRTFRRAALVTGPTVTGRTGSGAGCARGTCGANGDIIQIEFVIVAASPWSWTDTVPLLDVGLPVGGTGPCVQWCIANPKTGPSTFELPDIPSRCTLGECQHAPCKAAVDACADPLRPVTPPPVPTAPDASFCVPLAPERACYTIDLSTRPQWSGDVPMITLVAGSKELRNIRITLYEKPIDTTMTCDQVADAQRCGPLNDVFVSYVPAGGAVTVDGQIGRATVECDGQCRTASTVFGSLDGGPLVIREMTCAMFCLCIETDPLFPPAADARMTFGVSGRGY